MPYLSTVQVQSEFKIKNFGQNQVYGADLWLISLKTKIWCNNVVSRRFGKYSFEKNLLSLNQPPFNNYTKSLETYCHQEKSFIKSEIYAMIEKSNLTDYSFEKEKKKWQNESWNKYVEISRIQGAEFFKGEKLAGDINE